ncbi:MAG: tetratricopeptide repeat protein [bacterium]|nr:tetratricopeptide repeat protein [bacterium]
MDAIMRSFSTFRDQAELFRKYTLDAIRRSDEYRGCAACMDDVLLLADRVVAACSAHLYFSQTVRITSSIGKIAEMLRVNQEPFETVETLMKDVELWLKPLFWLACPDRWAALQTAGRKSNLYACMRDLDLLSAAELELRREDAGKIQDPMRQLIFLSHEDRNWVTHETAIAAPHERTKFLAATLTTLIAPVYKHREAITERLRGLIASPLKLEQCGDLFALVDGERRRHLSQFKARSKWIAELEERLKSRAGTTQPYLLLTGCEGMGKSALCAKMTERLGGTIEVLGEHAMAARNTAPWLPAVLFHHGKQSSNPHEIVRFLITQANSLLLEPINLPEIPNESGLDLMQFFKPVEETVASYLSDRPQQTRSLGKLSGTSLTRTLSTVTALPTRVKETKSQSQILRNALYMALQKISHEHGAVVLIIDALDEMSADGTGLEFLPEQLPEGVTALVSARVNSPAAQWLRAYRDVERVELTGVDKDEVPLITGIKSEKGQKEAQFNERVLQATQGLPMLVCAVARDAYNCQDHLEQVAVHNSMAALFERQAQCWHGGGVGTTSFGEGYDDDDDLLARLLLFLAVCEPVAPVPLEAIQSYLAYCGINLSLPQLRFVMRPVSPQIEGLDTNQVKLAVRSFAEHVRHAHCGANDVLTEVQRIIGWLKQKHEEQPHITGRFLAVWLGDDSELGDKSAQLVLEILEEADTQFLCASARCVLYMSDNEDILPSFVTRFFLTASESGDAEAVVDVYIILCGRVGRNEDLIAAEHFLRSAVEKGNAVAMLVLGEELISGETLTQNAEEGYAWKKKAIECGAGRVMYEFFLDKARVGGLHSMYVTGMYLMDGEYIDRNIAEGERWLRKAAEAGKMEAMRYLAHIIRTGQISNCNREESNTWLRKAALAGWPVGLAAIDAAWSSDDDKVIEELLRSAEPEALCSLGLVLLDGTYGRRKEDIGEKLLRTAANANDAHAMCMLGARLISGTDLPKNVTESEHWLRKAIDNGDTFAMWLLASIFLKQGRTTPRQKEAIALCERAIAGGDMFAMNGYGMFLISGKYVTKNTVEGVRLIKQAADAGHAGSMLWLAEAHLLGKKVPKSREQAAFWLRKAAKNDSDLETYSWAQWRLAEGLLNGNIDATHVHECDDLLCELSKMGSHHAMYVLGKELLSGKRLRLDATQGIEWLTKSAEEGHVLALMVSGYEMIKGTHVRRDILSGIKTMGKGMLQIHRDVMNEQHRTWLLLLVALGLLLVALIGQILKTAMSS